MPPKRRRRPPPTLPPRWSQRPPHRRPRRPGLVPRPRPLRSHRRPPPVFRPSAPLLHAPFPPGRAGSHASRQHPRRTRCEEELRLLLATSAHGLTSNSSFLQELESRLADNLDQLMALLEARLA